MWVGAVQGRIFPAPISLIDRNPRLGLGKDSCPPNLQTLCSEKSREGGSRHIKCIRPQTRNPEPLTDSVLLGCGVGVAKVPFLR